MKLEFQLLVVDDNPGSLYNTVELLRDHLKLNGFSLECRYASDLSEDGLKKLARDSGRNFDLVAVDFNLGRLDIDGAVAAARLRADLRYTDMVFYSSASTVNLLAELAKHEVPGVFVATRGDVLDEMLRGLADTVIGKAIDLNHMRGIAMAEVAEMDVRMEAVLEKVFASSEATLVQKGRDTLTKLLEGEEARIKGLRKIVSEGRILDVVIDGGLFSSMQRLKAINRVSKVLADKPADALKTFKDYDPDIIQNRNKLAHAAEVVAEDGTITLRAIKRGKKPVTIDDDWMKLFRSKLRTHKDALAIICGALSAHVDAIEAQQGDKA
ncbi:MAG TPA: hypothetical protein DDZ81_17945 [Acetobacteraceae bacterium]|nr:hypothetical protein [Acetobacteraceae bacterium]